MWNEYLKNQREAKVGRVTKFANPRAAARFEALTDRDGKHANTLTKKEEMPRWESFPPNEHNQYFELPPVAQAHQSVTE